jgi:hypothetical protein
MYSVKRRRSDKEILIEFYKKMERKEKENDLVLKLVLENINISSSKFEKKI